MPNYPHAITRKNWEKHGEAPSLLDFAGIVGDGVHDDAAGINNAIADVIAAGGLTLRIPGTNTFLVKSPIVLPAGVLNLTLVGDGDSSIVKRGANMSAGQGVFDIAGSNVTLRDFVIEGDVTVATGLNYSTITDPMQASLTLNTSVWLHGAGNLLLDGVKVQHTGGYSVLLDATAADVTNVTITACKFYNNRPHLFGTSALDLSYGSWTGGIHYQGNGTSHRVSNLTVTSCDFQRGTGNQIWGHAYAFTKMHSNIRVLNNQFLDIGRDAVQLAATAGGSVANNAGRRIGYIASDDTSAAQPKYLGGQYAVFIDTSGTTGVDYTGNSCVSALGAFFDLDGFAYGQVSGNTCRVPSASDPEYAEDLISSWPGNYTYGVQTANNYYLPGGTNVSITGNTFVNCGYGAIRLFSARGCHISGNTINHPATAAFAPIILGNFVPAIGGGQVDTVNCDVTGNNIQWTVAAAAIQELDNWGAGSMPWAGGEANWAADNRVFGGASEFAKAASSSSIAGTLISNAAAMGVTASAASMYSDTAAVHLSVNGGAFKPVARVAGSANHVQFNAASGVDLAGSADLTWDDTGKILALGGGVATGVQAYAYNSRATGANIGFQLANSNFQVDGNGNVVSNAAVAGKDFVLINSTAPTTGAGFGYLYADASAIHVSVNGGAFAALGVVAGANTQVQFNSGGALGASANLTWNNGSQVLTIAGGTATGVAAYSFNSQATGANIGFQLANSNFQVDGNGNVASNAAVAGKSFVLINSTAPTTGTGFGYLYADASAIHVSVNGGTFAALPVVAGSSTQVQFNSSGALGASGNFTWNNGGQILTIAGGAATGVAAYAFNSQATAANIGFQLANSNFLVDGNGNVTSSAAMTANTHVLKNSTAPTTASGFAYFYADSSAVHVSVNGGAFTALAVVAGSSGQVQFNSSGAFGASSNLTWNNGGQVLTIAGGAATGVAAYAFNSQATGSNIGFQLASSNFLVDGNGNVTSSGVMTANAHVLKNSSAPSAGAGFAYIYADSSAIHISVNGGAFASVINASNSWVSGGGVLCPHAASIAGGNFFVTKNSDTAYISGIDDNFLDQGGTARYFVGGIYIGTSPISR